MWWDIGGGRGEGEVKIRSSAEVDSGQRDSSPSLLTYFLLLRRSQSIGPVAKQEKGGGIPPHEDDDDTVIALSSSPCDKF